MGAQGAPVGTPQASSVSTERSALAKVMWFGVLGVVGIVSSWVLSFYIFGTIFVTSASLNLPPNATQSQVGAALGPIFQSLGLLIPVAVAVGLFGDALLTMAFRDLAKVGNAMFSLPWKLMIVLMAGAVLAAGGVIPLFYEIPSIIAQAPSGSGTPSAAFFSAISNLIFAVLVASIGGILAIVGIIGGQILGLWRVGSKYNETFIKVGAIFVIIPFLNFLAPIFVLVGAYQARGRLPRPM